MKRLLRLLLYSLGLTLGLLVVGAAWIWYRTNPSYTKVAALLSPDRNTLAVVLELDAGQPEGSGYLVQLINRNRIFSWPKVVAGLTGTKLNHCAGGVELDWGSRDTLLIKYQSTERIELFLERVTVDGVSINVDLRPGPGTMAASCGDMRSRLRK